MADPQQGQQPMTETMPGMPAGADPVAQFKAYMQAQQSSQQMGPSMSHTQAQAPQPREEKRTDYAAQAGGGKASLKDLGNSIQNVVGQVTQKIQQRKATEQQHLFDRFTNSVQGIQQAQQQLQAAQEALKQNPQDPQAIQSVKQAQQAMQQNQTILDAMFNGPHGDKYSKLLAKGFGIDDKNKDTPERQNAIAALKKSMGVGDKAAGLISQIPMTAQQQPGGGIKPPTGGQILNAELKQQQMQQQDAIARLKIGAQQGMSLDHLKMVGTLKGIDVSKDSSGNLVTHIMGPEERAKVPFLKAQDDLMAAKAEAERAMTDSKMNKDNPEMKIKMMNAQSNAIDAQARMLSAQAAQMRAMTAKAKEPPAVAEARKAVTKLNEDLARTQLAIANKNAGFFGGEKYDEGKAQSALKTLTDQIRAKQEVIDAYQAGQKSGDTSDEDILKGIDELNK